MTAAVGDQIFAVPVSRVRDVFPLAAVTPVPLAPPDVVGLMNLRGRVVTAIELRARLGLAGPRPAPGAMTVGIEAGPDSFGLVVDRVGDVVELGPETRHENPVTLDARWSALSRAVHQIGRELVIEVDVDELLGLRSAPAGVAPTQGGSPS